MSPKIDYDKLAAEHGGTNEAPSNFDSLAAAAEGGPAPIQEQGMLSKFGGPAALLAAGGLVGAARGKVVGSIGKDVASAMHGAPRTNPLSDKARAAALKTLAQDQGPIGHIVRFMQEMQAGTPSVPTRPITVEGKPARAPAQTSKPKYTGGRGASGPELARRTEAMAAAKQGTVGRGIPPLVAAEMPAAGSLEEQLARSIALEQAMGAKGIPPGLGRVPLRAGVRGMTGNPELDMLMFILGSQNVPEQIDQAQHVLQESRRGQISPALFRALYGNGPQGT